MVRGIAFLVGAAFTFVLVLVCFIIFKKDILAKRIEKVMGEIDQYTSIGMAARYSKYTQEHANETSNESD